MNSFVSAVTLLGNPVEVYYYGQQWTFLCFIPMGITIWYLYLPVFHELKLTSAYQASFKKLSMKISNKNLRLTILLVFRMEIQPNSEDNVFNICNRTFGQLICI